MNALTKVLSFFGSLAQISKIRGEFNAKTIMLVTGKTSYVESGAKRIVDIALQYDTVVHFNDFDMNPKIEDAERGVALAVLCGVELIIAIGGGSVLDMAKLIKAFYSAPEKSKELSKGELAVTDANLPMIFVPTTAGSGSEMTNFSVVYIGHDKYSLISEHLLPNAVILDGSLITSASRYQLVCSGLDAFAQAIESSWAVGSTKQSREYAFDALALCMKHFQNVLEQNADEDALQGMMEASSLAGRAINISKTTSAHAWSYAITTHYGVPHGHAVWLTLPKIFEIHATASNDLLIDPRGIQHLRGIMLSLMDTLGIKSVAESAKHLRLYIENLSIESELREIGADTNMKRAFLSKQVNVQRMLNNPVAFKEQHIHYVFDCYND